MAPEWKEPELLLGPSGTMSVDYKQKNYHSVDSDIAGGLSSFGGNNIYDIYASFAKLPHYSKLSSVYFVHATLSAFLHHNR